MFPLNLQRNIVQLDRQISLLENECKNMEIEKKKKSHKFDPTYSSCSNNPNVRLKPPNVRMTGKKTDSSKRSRRPTPPVSSRLQSTGSLPSHCSRNGEPLLGRKSKLCCLNSKPLVYSSQTLGSPQSNPRRDKKCGKCPCHSDITVSDLVNDDTFDVPKKDHVLLFPNPGGTIQVTVTQKPNSGKENSPVSLQQEKIHQKALMRRAMNLEKDIAKDLDGCKCQNKGQKWSEILCVDSSKKSQPSNGICVKNKIHAGETKILHQPLNLNNKRKSQENPLHENHNNSGSTIQEDTFEIPVKLSPQFSKTKKQSEFNKTTNYQSEKNKFEKEIQCSLESWDEGAKELKDPMKIFQVLINQFQQMSGKSSDTNAISKVEELSKGQQDRNKNNSNDSSAVQNNVSYVNAVKHHCENLLKEKSLLTEELGTKDNMITVMKKREEEYLSLISSLKASLEKTKEHAEEGMEAVKQMNIIKSKLLEQMKVSELLKKKLTKLHDDVIEYNVENSQLRTEIKILRLEGQKHVIMMAGKDAEINRYKEEIQNFQKQIEEHLNSLRKNAQVADIEKMIEAIMHQSQIFVQTDLDSLIEKDEKDEINSSRLQNVLIHSSPTSTKPSVVNSSWKQISSIHENDGSKAGSDVIYLNDDKNEKNFFEMFGENFEAKKAKEPLVEKFVEKREVKNSSSFTGCTSLHEDPNTSRESLVSKESLVSVEEARGQRVRKSSEFLLDKAHNNIEELLKNMKLKFSKEIFETTLPSGTTEDHLDISQISSVTVTEMSK